MIFGGSAYTDNPVFRSSVSSLHENALHENTLHENTLDANEDKRDRQPNGILESFIL